MLVLFTLPEVGELSSFRVEMDHHPRIGWAVRWWNLTTGEGFPCGSGLTRAQAEQVAEGLFHALWMMD